MVLIKLWRGGKFTPKGSRVVAGSKATTGTGEEEAPCSKTFGSRCQCFAPGTHLTQRVEPSCATRGPD